jgi:hypothetical protein
MIDALISCADVLVVATSVREATRRDRSVPAYARLSIIMMMAVMMIVARARGDAAVIVVVIIVVTGAGAASVLRAWIAIIAVWATIAGTDRSMHALTRLPITIIVITVTGMILLGDAAVIMMIIVTVVITRRLAKANLTPTIVIVVIIPRGHTVVIAMIIGTDAKVFRAWIEIIAGRARRGAGVCAEVIVHVVPVVALLVASRASGGHDAIAAAGRRARVSAAVRVDGVPVVALLTGVQDAVAATRSAVVAAGVVVVRIAVVALLAGINDSIVATCASAISAASIGFRIGVSRAVVALLAAIEEAIAALRGDRPNDSLGETGEGTVEAARKRGAFTR